MAALNSLTYIMYSLLTMAPNNTPTTEPSLNAFETSSESLVTETWRQEPHYVTRKFNEESCPAGETWSDCDAGCEATCETVGKPIVCPRMCIPGCVCEDPGTVRGPDNKCIHPPLCKSGDVDPYERVRAEQDPYIPSVDPDETVWTERYPGNPKGSCPAGEKWSRCNALCQKTCKTYGKPQICPLICAPGCVCEDPETVRGPDNKCIHHTLCKSGDVDPYERVRAEQDPYIPSVDPDETVSTERYPGNSEDSSDQPLAEQDPHHPLSVTKRSCPAGEKWSRCLAHCQATCKTYGKPQICPFICAPGCVCEDPETVRGPDNKCIHHTLCKSGDVDPDETVWTEGYPVTPRVDPYERVRAEQDPYIPSVDPDESIWSVQYPVTPRVDPYERVRAEQDPYIPSVDPDESNWSVQYPVTPRVDPYERVRAEQDPYIPSVDPDESIWSVQYPVTPRVDPDEPSRAKIFWQAERYPKVSRVDPDEHDRAEQDIDIRTGHLDNSGGCPNKKACSDYCKPKLGFCMFGRICFCAK
ncbi:unnamed protein product [Larinioides sclopetarius]|uniref:TIL domain-containing protein n=1 Tax=Larinioides sclopetarius TaxID=280406 RepID=A0AAV2BPE8_9ARAC